MCKTRLILVLHILASAISLQAAVHLAGAFFDTPAGAAHLTCLIIAGGWVSAEMGKGEAALRRASLQVFHAGAIPASVVFIIWAGLAFFASA